MPEKIFLPLPSLSSVMRVIERIVRETRQLGMFCLNVVEFGKSSSNRDIVFNQAVNVLRELRGEILKRDDIICLIDNTPIIILSGPREKLTLDRDSLRKIKDRISSEVQERVERHLGYYETQGFGLYIGYALLEQAETPLALEELLAKGREETLRMAVIEEHFSRWKKMVQPDELLTDRYLALHLQPIAYLTKGEILGYEVLNRYPKQRGLEYPQTYFSLAARADVDWALMEISKRDSLLERLRLNEVCLLIHSTPDPQGEVNLRREAFEEIRILPEGIIIGLSESKIYGPQISGKIIREIKEKGFKVAIDEVNGEAGRFIEIASFQPDFIRLDITMIKGIEKDPLRQELLRDSLAIFKEYNIPVIALGIESDEEFRILLELGVDLGETFLRCDVDMSTWQGPEVTPEDTIRCLPIRGDSSGLISVPFATLSLRSILDRRGQIGILYLNIVQYSHEEEARDWPVWNMILKATSESLEEMKGHIFRREDILSVYQDERNNLIILLSPPRTKPGLEPSDLEGLSCRIDLHLKRNLDMKLGSSALSRFGFYIGYGIVKNIRGVFADGLVSMAVKEAAKTALNKEQYERWRNTVMLKQLIDERNINIVFQSIVHLANFEILGYEAFSRGPKMSGLESPHVLFNIAKDADMVWILERICQEKASHLAAARMKGGARLFLNINPLVVNEPRFKTIGFKESILKPKDIVFEMSQHPAIKEPDLFGQAVRRLRSQGFGIAVDEIKSGFGEVQFIKEFSPDFVKIDISLVRGIDEDLIRQDLVKAIVKLAEQAGFKVIAVGIETEKEYSTISSLGIEYGQGYFIAKPDEEIPEVLEGLQL